MFPYLDQKLETLTVLTKYDFSHDFFSLSCDFYLGAKAPRCRQWWNEGLERERESEIRLEEMASINRASDGGERSPRRSSG